MPDGTPEIVTFIARLSLLVRLMLPVIALPSTPVIAAAVITGPVLAGTGGVPATGVVALLLLAAVSAASKLVTLGVPRPVSGS